VCSGTYRQASAANEAALRDDPMDAGYRDSPWRRLDAEAIRDSLLAAVENSMSACMVPTCRRVAMPRAEIVVADTESGAHRPIDLSPAAAGLRFSVYWLCSTRRPSSSTACHGPARPMPLQSLSLLNSEFVVARGPASGRAIDGEHPADESAR